MSYTSSNDYYISFDTKDFLYSSFKLNNRTIDENMCNNVKTRAIENNCDENTCVDSQLKTYLKLCKNMDLSKEYINLTTNHLGSAVQQKDAEKVYKDQYRKLANVVLSIGLVTFFIVKINNNSI